MDVGEHLESLYQRLDVNGRLAADPVRFAHRYSRREDQEIAGLIAAWFAFGRTAAFGPVLDEMFAAADRCGGPARWVHDGHATGTRTYRWVRPNDVTLLLGALRRALDGKAVEELFLPAQDARSAITRASTRLRAALEAESSGSVASRGLAFLLADPSGGSACKRWNMYLRWMVRPTREGIDLGLWSGLSPAQLVVPLDTHVLRIGRFIGLTARRDGSWRTAVEVTQALATIDPVDPVRFDFALAHLGISRACRGHRVASVCPACPLDPVCVAPNR